MAVVEAENTGMPDAALIHDPLRGQIRSTLPVICNVIFGVDGDANADTRNVRANYLAACAAYVLRDFRNAERLFTEQLRMCPEDATALSWCFDSRQRRDEMDHGRYDFSSIIKSLSSECPVSMSRTLFGGRQLDQVQDGVEVYSLPSN